MGNTDDKYRRNNYSLDVDEKLMSELEKELNIKKNKKQSKHFKKVIQKKLKGNIKKTNFYQKFNKNEKGIKNISNLLNLIYDENINQNFKSGTGRTIYEGVFGHKYIPNIQNDNKNNISEILDDFDNENNNIDVHNSYKDNL